MKLPSSESIIAAAADIVRQHYQSSGKDLCLFRFEEPELPSADVSHPPYQKIFDGSQDESELGQAYYGDKLAVLLRWVWSWGFQYGKVVAKRDAEAREKQLLGLIKNLTDQVINKELV